MNPFPTVQRARNLCGGGDKYRGACWVELQSPRKKAGCCRDLPGDMVNPLFKLPGGGEVKRTRLSWLDPGNVVYRPILENLGGLRFPRAARGVFRLFKWGNETRGGEESCGLAVGWLSFQPAESQSPIHRPLGQRVPTALLWG